MSQNLRSTQRSRVLNSPRRRLNQIMIWPLGVIAFLAPLFMGGNLPIYWLIWAITAGLLGTIWFGWLALHDETPRLPPGHYRALFAAFILFALYHLVQIAPLGGLVPALRSHILPDATFALTTISTDPGETLLALLRWLTFGLLFFLVLQVCAISARNQSFLDLIFWTIVLHAFIGLTMRFQFGDTLLGIPKWAYAGSTTGGFVNRNSFATYLAFGCVLAVTRIMSMSLTRLQSPKSSHVFDFYTSPHGVMPFIIGWIIILVALVTTNSRMGLFSAIAGMGFVIATLWLRKPKSRRRGQTWLLPIIALGALFIALIIYGADLYTRAENLYLNDDLSLRRNLYQQVWWMIRDRPLTGFGGGAFVTAYPLYHQLPVSLEHVWNKTHSSYLALWVEYGLIVGSIPMLILAAFFVRFLLAIMRASPADPLIVAAAGTLVVAALHSLIDFSLEMEGAAIVFTMIMGAGFARVITQRDYTSPHSFAKPN